jgi:hypothetical protein
MPLWDVTVRRTELITFRVEAPDPETADAEAFGGEEIASKTKDCTTVSIEPVHVGELIDLGKLTHMQRVDPQTGEPIGAPIPLRPIFIGEAID